MNTENDDSSCKESEYPSEFQKKTLWLAITALSCGVLFVLLVIMGWLTGQILSYLQQVLLPIAIAGIIAYLLDPIVNWLQRRKIKRTMAVMIVLGSFFIFAGGVIATIIPPIIDQTNTLIRDREEIMDRSTAFFEKTLEKPYVKKLIENYYEATLKKKAEDETTNKTGLFDSILPSIFKKEEPKSPVIQILPNDSTVATDATKLYEPPSTVSYFQMMKNAGDNSVVPDKVDSSDKKEEPVKEVKELSLKEKLWFSIEYNSSSYIKVLMNWLSASGIALTGSMGWLIGLFLIPLFVFVFLKESQSIAQRWSDILPIRTSRFKEEVVSTLNEINGYLIAFFRGQMIVSLIDGCFIGIGLWILGMPYAFLIGVAVALLGIIPYIGIFSVYIPTLLLSWFVWHDWQHLVWVSAIFLGVNQFDSWIVQPKIVGNAVGLHEVTVIFSVIFWSLIFGGIVGALLAVPLTASIKVIFQRYVWENIKEKAIQSSIGQSVLDPEEPSESSSS